LVIPRLSEGTTHSTSEKIDPPTVSAIRMVFGVGRRARTEPSDDAFAPVYTVSIPVFSLGGLDSDGVYEFDAVGMLAKLQSQAVRRTWAMRLELDIVQSAETVSLADVTVQTPYLDEGPSLSLMESATLMGGARQLTVVSTLAHTPSSVGTLGGKFALQVRDSESDDGPASTERPLELNLTRFEFQG
jgi:hypothetical protein